MKCLLLQHIKYVAPSVCRDHDFEHVRRSVSKTLEVCGFLDISDISSPPYISRHIVLPTVPATGQHRAIWLVIFTILHC